MIFQVTATIACLKERTASELLAQMWNLNLGFLEFPFAIVSRDKNFFREFDAFTALRNKQYRRDVNLMIGINHDEGMFSDEFLYRSLYGFQETTGIFTILRNTLMSVNNLR